jgi:hypothetical protein
MSVKITGGCCLLNLEPFRKYKIRYECDKNGEDANICGKLRDLGYQILIDTSDELETLHLQEIWLYHNRKLIEEYKSGKKPDYFGHKEIYKIRPMVSGDQNEDTSQG